MSALDDIISRAVAREDMPFVVAVVVNSGGILWEGSAGWANPSHVAGPDTVFRLWSMTKAFGSLAAMIMVDRGAMSLETPVGDVLPEFDQLRVYESAGPDGPIFRQPRRRATLRHLLTHTSGLAYDAYNQKMLEYQNITRNPDHLSGTVSGFNFPLMFDPGDDFAYGIGVDWAGYMVQRLDGRSIDRFVADEILRPLGLTDTVFEADSLRDRLADPVLRRPGGFVPFEMSPPAHPEMYGMGHSLYSTASDYARLLRLVLNGGELDGYRVISKETHQLVVTNQMGDTLVPDPIYSFVPDTSATINLLEGIPKTHTASFFRNEAAVPYGRSEGSLTWGGFMNTHFWIDPVKDIAAVFMSQSCPFYDPAFMAVYAQFEREVYSLFRA